MDKLVSGEFEGEPLDWVKLVKQAIPNPIDEKSLDPLRDLGSFYFNHLILAGDSLSLSPFHRPKITIVCNSAGVQTPKDESPESFPDVEDIKGSEEIAALLKLAEGGSHYALKKLVRIYYLYDKS